MEVKLFSSRPLAISIHPMGSEDNGTCVLGGSLSPLWKAPEARGMAMAARTALTATTIHSTREDPRVEARRSNVLHRRVSPPKLDCHLSSRFPFRPFKLPPIANLEVRTSDF